MFRRDLPRAGARADGILFHPDPELRLSLVRAAAAAGHRLDQAVDAATAWTAARAARAALLVAPVAALDAAPWFGGDAVRRLRIVALVADGDSARCLVRVLRRAPVVVVGEDEAADRIVALLAERGEEAVSPPRWLAACDPLPSRTAWQQLLIDEALRRSGGCVARAARLLGISRQALHLRLAGDRQAGLTPDQLLRMQITTNHRLGGMREAALTARRANR